LGIGKTRLYELAHEGRLKLVNVGPASVALIEDDDKSPGSIDALIEELIAAGHTPKVVPVRPKAKRRRWIMTDDDITPSRMRRVAELVRTMPQKDFYKIFKRGFFTPEEFADMCDVTAITWKMRRRRPWRPTHLPLKIVWR
jgi:hypothetical protein